MRFYLALFFLILSYMNPKGTNKLVNFITGIDMEEAFKPLPQAEYEVYLLSYDYEMDK